MIDEIKNFKKRVEVKNLQNFLKIDWNAGETT